MTMLPRRPKTPQERVAATIERFALDMPERPVGVWIADLRALHEIAAEVEQLLNSSAANYCSAASLCVLVGQYHGQAGHDWGEWREPYEGSVGGWFRIRTCQRCHEREVERCDAPTDQDDAE